LALLVATATTWGENIIMPNYENEAETFSPSSIADHLYGVMNWTGETGWSTQAWLPNSPDFSPLADRGDSVHLQIFPQDNRWEPWQIPGKLGDCVAHARVDKGFRFVGVTYQTYAGAIPAWYDCGAFMHSSFPGNLIGHGEWGTWYK